jgi:hypothetical protein
VSLIELNAHEDERLVGIKVLQEGKMKAKKVAKKRKRNDILVCVQYINVCKLGAN